MTTGIGKTPQNQLPNLAPPWYTIANMIKCTVGLTPGITVGELDTSQAPFSLPITVRDSAQAEALATILQPEYNMGNIQVQVQVIPGNQLAKPAVATDAEHVQQLIQTALKENPLLVDVKLRPVMPMGPAAVWPIIAKSVVQFPNDDISDFYTNFNGVAAEVFRTVLLGQISGTHVACSTSNE